MAATCKEICFPPPKIHKCKVCKFPLPDKKRIIESIGNSEIKNITVQCLDCGTSNTY